MNSNWMFKVKLPPCPLDDPQIPIRRPSTQQPRELTRRDWQTKHSNLCSSQRPRLLHAPPFLDQPLFRYSAPYSTKTSFAYTIQRSTHGRRCSLENALFTSTWVLLVRRGQPSCEGLPPPLGHPEVNCRTEGGIDWRLNGPEGCSGEKGSLLNPGGGFCLAQPAKSAPRLPLVNRFAVLDVEEVNTDIYEPIDAPSLSAPDRIAQSQRPK